MYINLPPFALVAACAACGFVLGAVPFGRLVAYIGGNRYLADGTGNPGALSWLAMGKTWAGVVTGLCEAGKVVAAITLGYLISLHMLGGLVAGLFALAGHAWPVFSKFRPCHATAPWLGFWLGLSPLGGILATLLWFFMFWRWHRPLLASMATFLGAPLLVAPFVHDGIQMAAAALAGVMGLWHFRHAVFLNVPKLAEVPWYMPHLFKTAEKPADTD